MTRPVRGTVGRVGFPFISTYTVIEGIAIGIKLSDHIISDLTHNRNTIVLLESCESLTSNRVDLA